MLQALSIRKENILSAIRNRWALWLTITLGFTFLYYVSLMVALIIKFENFPNYWEVYNWPANVWRIIISTPSVKDMLPIILDEWLFEFGYMNYAYGNGISEWALNIIPAKALVVLTLGALIATNYVLISSKRNCPASKRVQPSATAGVGAFLVAITSATMSWVVCCATPSWIVGLSMMGLGVSVSLWVEPIGPYISLLGFALLLIAIYLVSKPAKDGRSKLSGGKGSWAYKRTPGEKIASYFLIPAEGVK